ncbi:MAG: CoA transferase [Actinomycetaceae bacterium]|jgi:crotonobetainyl-CoA:carnitine CoA-transferase CaiB-like acyl-CoA transferase|nr:CoA transferase [Actinomycetaceae bacterium]
MNPLQGIKVVDMTAFLAAPTVARILGEWGADVIKVEAPKGDPGRTQGAVFGTPYTDDENLGFDMSNMNKRFMTIDLRQEEGHEVMDRLLADADVFLTSTRVKSLKKLGYDFETLHEKFPRLVMAQVLGFGKNGPLKDAAGFDMTACMSRGGVLGTQVNRGDHPMIPANGYGDFQVSFVLAAGILAALVGREKTGEGDYVTTSLFHSGVFMINTAMISAQYGNEYPKDRREVINPFNNTYTAGDGKIITLCAPEYDRDWDKVVTLLGREDLVGNERYNVCDDINANGLNGEVVDIIDEAIAKKPRSYWLDLFLENDVPAEACQLPNDIYEDEQGWANDVLRKVRCDSGNERMIPTNPVRFDSQGDPELKLTRAQGSDTVEILGELGYSPEDIDRLLASGAAQGTFARN